jgi:hypothetical protein
MARPGSDTTVTSGAPNPSNTQGMCGRLTREPEWAVADLSFPTTRSLTGFENELERIIERDGLAFLHCGVETPFSDRGDGGLVQ